jgi:hypothetical protein
MARRRVDPRPARAHIALLESEPEKWGVRVTNLAVLVAEGDGFFLDTTRHEDGGNWTFLSKKKLQAWLRREGFRPTQDWRYWERPLPIDYRVADVLEAWDTLVRFTTWERTPARVEWLVDNYEIQGSVEDWIENKFPSVIDEYAKRKGLTYDEAQAELEKRPYGRPL